MKMRWIILSILASALIALGIRVDRLSAYENESQMIADLACDIVTTRAQAGSTRDVHDQIFSFLRKHSPDPRAEVLIRVGGREIGSQTTGDSVNRITHTCRIQNAGDYEISISAAKPNVLDLTLARYFFFAILTLLAFGMIIRLLILTARRILSSRLLEALMEELGLQVITTNGNKFFRAFARIILLPLEKIEPVVRNLKRSHDENQIELSRTKEIIHQLDEDKVRANGFADTVRQVRHDMKGPLSALKLAATQNSLSERRDLLPDIIKSVEKILLDLDHQPNSELEADAGQFEIAEVILNEAVQEARSRISKDRGITLSFDFDAGQLNPVFCRPDYFRRMMSNLMQNAIEAVGDDGVISVRVYRQDSKNLVIEIEDNGVGVPPERRHLLFQKHETHGKEGGDGLGLYFAKTCVTSWGGSIDFATPSGRGARFVISLPIAPLAVNFLAELPNSHSLTVLDDDIDLQRQWWLARNPNSTLFSSPDDFMLWFEHKGTDPNLNCVIDFNLNHAANGADVIRTIGVGENIYLATDDYLNPEAIEIAVLYHIPILPKSLLFSTSSL